MEEPKNSLSIRSKTWLSHNKEVLFMVGFAVLLVVCTVWGYIISANAPDLHLERNRGGNSSFLAVPESKK